MKKNLIFLKLILLIFTATLITSCDNDDDNNITPPVIPQPTGDEIVYNLTEVADSGISGTATIKKFDDNSITVELDLNDTDAGASHPAHIHFNTAVEGGDIAIDLEPVDGTAGSSSVNFSTRNDDTAITYEELLNFDGHINVHQSADDGTIIAQGDIGGNELTGEFIEYDLLEKDDSGISGTAKFEERRNETTLVTLMLEETPEGGIHPAHIHTGPAVDGGDIAEDLNPVDGTTGISRTQIRSIGTDPITYTELLTFDGHINVHLSEEDETIVAQGDIGSNSEALPVINYNVNNNGDTEYIFNGNGLDNEANPEITLTKGRTYTFTVNAQGHPFWIKTTQSIGDANAYNEGVTNNGDDTGTVTFKVPLDAPGTLYYNCGVHSAMTNAFTIVD